MATGYVYDNIFLKHDRYGHAENSNRLNSIINKLNEEKLIDGMINIPARPASEDELKICHSADHINHVKKICAEGGGNLDWDTYANEFSFDAASKAVGGLIELTDAALSGKINNGFALLRPPGHHAVKDSSMGFCIFGNVAIAAKSALNKGIKKIAVVDFDVHHGNGTQALVEDNESILFISTHQYPYYPGTGAIGETGKGNVINLPLRVGVGDEGFIKLYKEIITPAVDRFCPEIIFVSAGYDSHWKDPLASLGLSLNGYTEISEILIGLARKHCGGKIIFSLEGGYNYEILSTGVSNTIKLLLGRTGTEDMLGPHSWREPDLSDFIRQVKKVHGL